MIWKLFLAVYLPIGFAIGVAEFRLRLRVWEHDKYKWVCIPFNTLLWLPISLFIFVVVLIAQFYKRL